MTDVLMQVLADLAAEGDRVEALVADLDEAGWRTPTPAAGWDESPPGHPAAPPRLRVARRSNAAYASLGSWTRRDRSTWNRSRGI